jgi:phosphoserine phosphatase RsbU/P
MSFTDTASLVEILDRLNAQLEQSTDPDHFVTLFLGRLDTESHRLEYVNAGHIFPVLLAPGAAPVRLEATGIPAGMIPGTRYAAKTADIPPGSLLALYTDGIPEAASADGHEYGEERLHGILSTAMERPVGETMVAIQKDLDDYLAGVPLVDDTTVVLARRLR